MPALFTAPNESGLIRPEAVVQMAQQSFAQGATNAQQAINLAEEKRKTDIQAELQRQAQAIQKQELASRERIAQMEIAARLTTAQMSLDDNVANREFQAQQTVAQQAFTGQQNDLNRQLETAKFGLDVQKAEVDKQVKLGELAAVQFKQAQQITAASVLPAAMISIGSARNTQELISKMQELQPVLSKLDPTSAGQIYDGFKAQRTAFETQRGKEADYIATQAQEVVKSYSKDGIPIPASVVTSPERVLAYKGGIDQLKTRIDESGHISALNNLKMDERTKDAAVADLVRLNIKAGGDVQKAEAETFKYVVSKAAAAADDQKGTIASSVANHQKLSELATQLRQLQVENPSQVGQIFETKLVGFANSLGFKVGDGDVQGARNAIANATKKIVHDMYAGNLTTNEEKRADEWLPDIRKGSYDMALQKVDGLLKDSRGAFDSAISVKLGVGTDYYNKMRAKTGVDVLSAYTPYAPPTATAGPVTIIGVGSTPPPWSPYQSSSIPRSGAGSPAAVDSGPSRIGVWDAIGRAVGNVVLPQGVIDAREAL